MAQRNLTENEYPVRQPSTLRFAIFLTQTRLLSDGHLKTKLFNFQIYTPRTP